MGCSAVGRPAGRATRRSGGGGPDRRLSPTIQAAAAPYTHPRSKMKSERRTRGAMIRTSSAQARLRRLLVVSLWCRERRWRTARSGKVLRRQRRRVFRHLVCSLSCCYVSRTRARSAARYHSCSMRGAGRAIASDDRDWDRDRDRETTIDRNQIPLTNSWHLAFC